MNNKYLIYYPKSTVRDEWYDTLMTYANRTKIGIVSYLTPIIGNLSVSENILVAAYYHHRTSYKEGRKMVEADLKKYNMEHHIDSRSNHLNGYERFIVKYLQVKYLVPEWIVFLSSRSMYIAEYEYRIHEFLRCEDIDKSVII
ncbi:MAG: hypothetical protein C0602_12300 [Denitrovibrio sp.]|nr:MAG: hypothetical protein C0602_12300 [Denitrovibrio sp.]